MNGKKENQNKLSVLDIFSGIGGFSLGLERCGMQTVAFCETNIKARRVLRKHWPDVLIYNDVSLLTYEQLKADGIETIDLVCGGFPCQPFSNAGKREGKTDDRYLWPEMLRIIKEVRPTWVLGENVAGIVKLALDQVLSDLESEGYATQTFIVPACAVNAPHRRDRVWIVSHSRYNARGSERKLKREGPPQKPISGGKRKLVARNDVADTNKQYDDSRGHGTSKVLRIRSEKASVQRSKQNICDPPSARLQDRGEKALGKSQSVAKLKRSSWWEIEPELCRIFDELSERLDKDRLTTKTPCVNVVSTRQKEEPHGKKKEGNPRELLQSLQQEDGAKEVSDNFGGFGSLQKEKVLQSNVYGKRNDKRESKSCGIKKKGNQVQGKDLPEMRNNKRLANSSQRLNTSQQRTGEFTNTLCNMPYKVALGTWKNWQKEKELFVQNLWQACTEIGYVPTSLPEIPKTWESLNNEEKDWIALRISTGDPFCAEWPGTQRVTDSIPGRVDRLKQLGNAVVPQVVELIGRAIMEAEVVVPEMGK